MDSASQAALIRRRIAAALTGASKEQHGEAECFAAAVDLTRSILSEIRSTGAGRSEAEATEPERDVRPPGETLWLAHGAVFGAANGTWDDLALIDKVRWASVEDRTLRALPVQTTGGAGE